MTATALGRKAGRTVLRRISEAFGRTEAAPPAATGRRVTIDTENRILSIRQDGIEQDFPLFTDEAFEAISREWVRIGWSLRYYHTFTWLGQPILQLPEDLIRIQEVAVSIRPDVIIETGIFGGGSLLFYASLCETLGKGRVVGIDIEIPETTRAVLRDHALGHRIEVHQGCSVAPETLDAVRAKLKPGETVMVMLDSHHSHAHVAAELEAYAPLVTSGSCIVATDGIMHDLSDVPGGEAHWKHDNPARAAREFAARHPEFELRPPPRHINAMQARGNVTYWPDAWLWRK